MTKYLAQIELAPEGGYKGFGPLGLEGNEVGSIVFTNLLTSAIGLITLIAIIWFVFVLLTGALGIITSGGDKGANESAKKKITSGIIGLVVTISALFVVNLIGTIFGMPNILDIFELIDLLGVK